jgi:hypothetical protein
MRELESETIELLYSSVMLSATIDKKASMSLAILVFHKII